jgi:hypothetical protein
MTTAGNPATAYDFCVHPRAAALAQENNRLRSTLLDIAVEMVAGSEGEGQGKARPAWRMLDGELGVGVCGAPCDDDEESTESVY